MSENSLEHRIRVALGKALHHKHRTKSGSVNLEDVAAEHDVSVDQVKEQFGWLREQNLIGGPLDLEGEQIANVPAYWFEEHELTDQGLDWAEAGFPIRRTP